MIFEPFLLRALLAGLIVSAATGPLGAFVIWRRMAYFGDAVAHAAILGVALALGFEISVFIGTLMTALAMAFAVSILAGRGWAVDSLLGVLSHSALALGLIAVSFQPNLRVDLNAFLFGDILTVTQSDLVIIALGAVAVLALLIWRWDALLTATISEDLAQSHGINPKHERLLLTLALAVTVAVALKVVGALLIAALLIIPAAAARAFARGPEAMALIATSFSAVSVGIGLIMSLYLDTPAGPSIIAASAAIFTGSLIARSIRERR